MFSTIVTESLTIVLGLVIAVLLGYGFRALSPVVTALHARLCERADLQARRRGQRGV